ncbi:MAG: hypothetical protein HOP08_15205 [Cyclobacteriaceae bacterium]|nr:hypothetical protein [Cyclobacteriaceae bacterium]
MRKISLLPAALVGLSLLLFSFKKEAPVVPFHCLSSSVNMSADNGPNIASITMTQSQTVLFRTNCVNNASSYLWTIGAGYSTTTYYDATISIQGSYFLFAPPGGCEEFNANLSGGVYHTTLSAQADTSGSAVTIDVYITGVGTCN